MAINFREIPNAIRVPGPYIEIDATQAAQNIAQNQRILVIGQRRSTGTVAELTPTLVTSYAQAVDNFGRGSMLANMFYTLFQNNTDTEKWCVAFDDISGGTAATGTITVTVTTAEAGTISLYMGGVLVEVAVAAGDSVGTIGTAIRDAINANLELPVSATNSSGVVTVTYRHKGLVGNKYDMRVNYKTSLSGSSAGEATPTGVSIAIVQLSGGATDPDLDDAFAVLPDERFDYIVTPYIGSANLDFIDTELDSRWGSTRMLEGHAFVAQNGSVSTLSTLGNSRNNEHMSLLDCGTNSPTPPYIWVSALVGQVAKAASVDPAVPFNGLELIGVLPMPSTDRRTNSERNTLLYDGVATHNVTQDGTVVIERLLTTYQTDSNSLADATYLDANTLFTLAYLRQSLRSRISTRFARFKLADNGSNLAVGQSVVTPNTIKNEIVALAGEWEGLGLIEDLAQFKQDLIVERNENDATRVDVVLPPNLVNQFQIFAAQIRFIL